MELWLAQSGFQRWTPVISFFRQRSFCGRSRKAVGLTILGKANINVRMANGGHPIFLSHSVNSTKWPPLARRLCCSEVDFVDRRRSRVENAVSKACVFLSPSLIAPSEAFDQDIGFIESGHCPATLRA